MKVCLQLPFPFCNKFHPGADNQLPFKHYPNETYYSTRGYRTADVFGSDGPTYNITFRVDMNEVGDAFTTPEVNGTFNGWCGGCAPMSDGDGDGIWELTIPLAAGFYEYKFAYDSWAGSESLIPGSSCTITTGEFTNRALDVTGDATLDAVCWEAA